MQTIFINLEWCAVAILNRQQHSNILRFIYILLLSSYTFFEKLIIYILIRLYQTITYTIIIS